MFIDIQWCFLVFVSVTGSHGVHCNVQLQWGRAHRAEDQNMHWRKTARNCWIIDHVFEPPWSSVLEKLIVPQLVKKGPTVYGTWRFITTFTRSRYVTVHCPEPVKSSPHPNYIPPPCFCSFHVLHWITPTSRPSELSRWDRH